MTDYLLATFEAAWYHVVAGWIMLVVSLVFGYHYLTFTF